KIAMTAPVMQQGVKQPVTRANLAAGKESTWAIEFVMPPSYAMNNLPLPENKKIKITQLPPKKYVTIQFKGSSDQANLDAHESQLQDYIAKHHLKTIGQPIYAFYNP